MRYGDTRRRRSPGRASLTCPTPSRPTTWSTREEERERLAMPRHPLHDLYMGNAALAPHSTPLLLPFPLLSCREITSATSLQRVRCITFGGFLHGPLGSMRRSSPVTPAVDTVLAPKMHVGVSKPKLGDILSILTLSLVSKV